MGDADTRKAKSCSASHCCLCLKPTKPSKKTHKKTLQVPLFLFWWFFCRKCSPRLTKTNKYFIQCIMCRVEHRGKRKRASSRGHMLWIPNDIPVNVAGTVAQRGNARGLYTTESTSTLISFLPLSLHTYFSFLSDAHVEHAPHTNTYTGKTQAQL